MLAEYDDRVKWTDMKVTIIVMPILQMDKFLKSALKIKLFV